MTGTPHWPSNRDTPALGAIGVLARDDTLLVVQRAEGIALAGRWCFPGGRVEPGETTREAAVRELEEELGIVVEAVAPLGLVDVAGTRWTLGAWVVRLVSGELKPDPAEIADTRWLTPAAIEALGDGLPSNHRVLELWKRRLDAGS